MIHTAHLETVHASVLVATHQMWLGGESLQMNKFQQVSSDHNQMSLTGSPLVCGPGVVVPYHAHDAFDVIYSPSSMNRQTHVKTLPFRNFICRW